METIAKTNVVMTGATGYIGGTVLDRFLKREDRSSLNISVLVRSLDKMKKLEGLGVKPVPGSHSDTEVLEQLASEADFFFSMANADDLMAIRAILKGLEKRHNETGTVPSLIHTSGTGVLADNADGMFGPERIYDDMNSDEIESFSENQVHRKVDIEVVNADKQGYVKTYIVLPSTIYGIATGKLVDEGIQHSQSIQVPALIEAALDRHQAGMVGLGKNVWNSVHNEDIADLYLVIFDALCSRRNIGHGREGFYFGENGYYVLHDLCRKIGQELTASGRATNPEVTSFTDEEIQKYFQGSKYLGSNSRCQANRSRSIGWKPAHPSDGLFDSVKPETAFIIAAKKK